MIAKLEQLLNRDPARHGANIHDARDTRNGQRVVAAECVFTVNLASNESGAPLFRSRFRCTVWPPGSFCKDRLALLIAAEYVPQGLCLV